MHLSSLELVHRICTALPFKDPPKRPGSYSARWVHRQTEGSPHQETDLNTGRGTGVEGRRKGQLFAQGRAEPRAELGAATAPG